MHFYYYSKSLEDNPYTVNISERSIISSIAFVSARENLGHIDSFSAEYLRNISFEKCPQYCIFLNTPPVLCFKRIYQRDNMFENRISMDYLQALDTSMNKFFVENPHFKTYIIQITQNDTKEQVRLRVLDAIDDILQLQDIENGLQKLQLV